MLPENRERLKQYDLSPNSLAIIAVKISSMGEVVEGLFVKDSRGCRDGCINNMNSVSD